jgi:Carbonic anhydrase
VKTARFRGAGFPGDCAPEREGAAGVQDGSSGITKCTAPRLEASRPAVQLCSRGSKVSRPSPFRADKVFTGLDNARRIRTGHGFFEALIERALLRRTLGGSFPGGSFPGDGRIRTALSGGRIALGSGRICHQTSHKVLSIQPSSRDKVPNCLRFRYKMTRSLVSALAPAVKAVLDQAGNTLDNAIKQNVVINVEKLKNATPIIDKAVTEKRVRIVGAVYNLDSGRVELVG